MWASAVSGHLANRHKPSPSYQRTLIRSPRRPHTCPENGFCSSLVSTGALSPPRSNPRVSRQRHHRRKYSNSTRNKAGSALPSMRTCSYDSGFNQLYENGRIAGRLRMIPPSPFSGRNRNPIRLELGGLRISEGFEEDGFETHGKVLVNPRGWCAARGRRGHSR
jgi:hypothetical protein